MSNPVEEIPETKYQDDKRDDDQKDEKKKDAQSDCIHHEDDAISPADNGQRYDRPGPSDPRHLRVDTELDRDLLALRSPSAHREQSLRLEDDLALLEAERVASASTRDDHDKDQKSASSVARSRSRRSENVDEFDEATNPLHEKAAVYNPPENPNTTLALFIKKLHQSSFIIRYFTYIVPVVLLLLIPLLVGALAFPNASVGGVELLWFSVWLEIVWLTLWAGRVRPHPSPPPPIQIKENERS